MPCNFAQARECKARRATQKDNTIPANCLVGGFRLACVDAGYDLAAANSIRIQAKAATQGRPWVVSFFFSQRLLQDAFDFLKQFVPAERFLQEGARAESF